MDFGEYEYLEKMVENPEQQNTDNGDDTSQSGMKEHNRSLKPRNDDDSGLVSHSNRSKSKDDSHGRNRHRESGSSRHRSRSRDGEKTDRNRDRHRSSRDRYREREERNGKDQHRERDKGRDKYRERDKGRDKDRERDKGRDKDRERDKDIDRDRERDREGKERDGERARHRDRRSRSHSERHREDRERSRDTEYKERGSDIESRLAGEGVMGLRGSTSSSDACGNINVHLVARSLEEKKEDVAEPVADPERDQRTVFAYQISLRADERDVFEFFSRAGKVRDVWLIMDLKSRRSKGVGYIEFYDAMSVPMAIALSGQLLLGQPVMVKPSEAEKNKAQFTSSAVAGGQANTYSGSGRRIYVGNLHYNMTEEQLCQVFEPFGTVELIQLPLDDSGHCKGFGFIQFVRLDEAQAALKLNGQLDIAGRTIKVSAVTDNSGTQDAGKNTGDLDDDEGGSLHLNAESRATLMAKLDHGGTATSAGDSLGSPLVSNGTLPSAPPLAVQPGISPLVPSMPPLGGLTAPGLSVPLTDTIGVPSECLLLKNMFDPNVESEPDFDLDIKEDVQDECANFGTLKHIHVEKYSAGFVYLRFENTESAASAQRALHGRWFAGKMITATFITPKNYEAKFPDAKW